MSSRVVLVFGAGPNVGSSVSSVFSSRGYKVALVCRDPSEQLAMTADLIIAASFSDPSSIASIFKEVKTKLGVPSLVIYSPHLVISSPDPFSTPLFEWVGGLNTNLVSGYAAIQEAVAGFRTLPLDTPKTFIYTGNSGIPVPNPYYMNLGVSKKAAAHMIQCALQVYDQERFRFYFANERNVDGSPTFKDIGGNVHAEVYYELAEVREQRPWEFTFVKGSGYVDFEGPGKGQLGF